MARSMSVRVMRPPGPEPWTVCRSIPLRSARRRISGPASVWTSSTDVGEAPGTGAVSGGAAVRLAGAAVPALFGAEPGLPLLARFLGRDLGDTGSMGASGAPTGTVVPAGAEGHLPSWQEWRHAERGAAERTLAEAVAFVESRHPDLSVSGLLAEGEPSWVLREQGERAAMIVLGTRFLSARQELFTSTSVALPVMAHARCPVVVVREWEHALEEAPFLVVGVDGSTAAQTAVDFAFEEAALRHALALVTGTRGLGGFAGMLLGSVSQGVLHHAQCPIVTVPHPSGRP